MVIAPFLPILLGLFDLAMKKKLRPLLGLAAAAQLQQGPARRAGCSSSSTASTVDTSSSTRVYSTDTICTSIRVISADSTIYTKISVNISVNYIGVKWVLMASLGLKGKV